MVLLTKEILIVFGSLSILMLTLSKMIAFLASNNPLVSAPIMSAVWITLMILARKKKLGKWGTMFIRQMIKDQHGKRAIYFFTMSVFFLLISSSTIYLIHYGESEQLASTKKQLIEAVPVLKSRSDLMQTYNSAVSPSQLVQGLVTLPNFAIHNIPLIAAMESALNDQSGGWLLTIYTTALVGDCQIIGITLLYRTILRKEKMPEPVTFNFPKIQIKQKRITLVVIFMTVFVLSYQLGTMNQITKDTADTMISGFHQDTKSITTTDNISGAFFIFGHNTEVALLMFIPAFGMAMGTGAGFATGVMYKAAIVVSPVLAQKVPALALLFMSPFGLMELTAYSIGMSRSFILMSALRKKNLRKELKPTLKEIGIVVAILLAAGFVEFFMIQSGSKGVG